MGEARLPFGKQISPAQVDLRTLLTTLDKTAGDARAAHTAIGKAFFPKPTDQENERKSGMNAFLAARAYGLVTAGQQYELTPIARDLLATSSEDALNQLFARHILQNLYGLQMLEVIDSLQARGETINASRVTQELAALGIDAGGSSGENVNPLRLWLQRGGVLKDTWTIDATVLKSLTGASTDEISELVALPRQHQAILRALATVTDAPPHVGSKIRELAEAQSLDVTFDTKSFAPKVLGRLADDGWIVSRKVTTGRGAKPHEISPTARFTAIISEPLMNTVLDQTHVQDPASLRRPIVELLDIVEDDTKSNHQRGLALEGVCIQLVRMLGYRFIGWRLRSDQTNGAEVDVVAESMRGPYALIQVQSKASAINGREVVDREVGVSLRLKSNVIVFVSAKKVGPAARRAAAAHMQESNLTLLFIEGADLRGGGGGITTAIHREWDRAGAIRSRRSQERTQSLAD